MVIIAVILLYCIFEDGGGLVKLNKQFGVGEFYLMLIVVVAVALHLTSRDYPHHQK